MLLAAALLGAGCASDGTGAPSKPAAPHQTGVLAVGLTREQVIAIYGKTDNIRWGSGGEKWVYNLSRGEVFIPWNFGQQPKLRIVDFDQDGKVKSWSSSR